MPEGKERSSRPIECEDETFVFKPVDGVVSYPSYKSFDQFVDIERLRSLDGYIRKRIRRHMIENTDEKFYTGPYLLDGVMPTRPGSRMIYLSSSSGSNAYFDLDQTELWQPTDAATEFALLTEFITTLPFRATGRMLVMYDDAPNPIPAHRDHVDTEVLHDFVWMRTNDSKPFYLLNCDTNEKKFIEGYTAWFDTVNQFHGGDASEGLTFSIRVDGVFTDEFKAAIPKPSINPASTPSYWACTLAAGN